MIENGHFMDLLKQDFMKFQGKGDSYSYKYGYIRKIV